MEMNTRHKVLLILCTACVVLGPVSVTRAIPPDPDNAALVYYQALLATPNLDGQARSAVFEFGRGEVGLTEGIEESVDKCRVAIGYAIDAGKMQHCNWGLRFSKGFSLGMPHLAPVRFLTHAILADARILAADGATREAFEHCLTVKRMGRHLDEEVLISLLVAIAVDGAANRCIRDLLGIVDADAETLRWLRAELAVLADKAPSLVRALEYERDIALEMMRPEKIDQLVDALQGSEAEISAEELSKMDEAFLAQSRQHYSDHINAMRAVLAGPGGYEVRYRKLTELAEQLGQVAAQDETAVIAAEIAPGLNKVYAVQIRGRAKAYATSAAVELYLAKATTGRLPAELPTDLPKDAYTGRNFEYELTDTGFVLRCGAVDPLKDVVHEFPLLVK
jgi:hypothetical protein